MWLQDIKNSIDAMYDKCGESCWSSIRFDPFGKYILFDDGSDKFIYSLDTDTVEKI